MYGKAKYKIKAVSAVRLVPAVLFLIFIFSMMIFSYTGKAKAAVESTTATAADLEELTLSFEEKLQEEIYRRNDFINLNGLTTRVLGIHNLNLISKLENGHLASYAAEGDISDKAEKLIGLDVFLKERGIPFLYVQVPYKYAYYDAPYPPGYESTVHRSYDAMADMLNDAGVSLINMGDWFEEKGWSMDDAFFRTDHHWRPEAAFEAAGLTMEHLAKRGLVKYEPAMLDEENWKISVYEDSFLGSSGLRTGLYYAGADDFSVYEPEFATDYSYAALRTGGSWFYPKELLNREYLASEDYFNAPLYEVYMHGDYSLRRTTNTEAYNDKRLMICGDSFKTPLEYFLTTQFKEIYTVDTRNYDASLLEYVEEVKPDILLMCMSSFTNEKIFNFGVDEFRAAEKLRGGSSVLLGDVSIKAQADNSNNFVLLQAALEPGQPYTLSLDKAVSTDRERPHIEIELRELSENKSVCRRYFEADSNEPQRRFFNIPEDGSGTYAFFLYAGMAGQTENVSVELKNVRLEKGFS